MTSESSSLSLFGTTDVDEEGGGCDTSTPSVKQKKSHQKIY
jgi:hypothetical protein